MADEWVQVRNCGTIFEANFIRSVLEGSNIESFLPDEHMAGLRPELSLAIGGVRVMVRRSDLQRATEVLNNNSS